MEIVLRRAAAEDMPEIMTLIDSVFEEQGIPKEMNPIPEDRNPQWWCAAAEEKIVGAVAVFCNDGVWNMGRFGVVKEMRGQKIGTRLLEYALAEVFEKTEIEELHMEARPMTVHILLKNGAILTGKPFIFYQGTCTPVLLRKEDFLRKKNA